MNLSTEALIVLGVIAFYIYDSAILVYSNNLVFSESFGRWFVFFPSESWRISGKLLFIPNPLIPCNLLFLSNWTTSERLSEDKLNNLLELINAARPLRIVVMSLMILLIIILPLSIFNYGVGFITLMSLLLIYIIILGMLIYTFLYRRKLGLDTKVFFSLAFEAISCPPFALNIIRKITLRQQPCSCSIEFASKYLEVKDSKEFCNKLHQKITEELLDEDNESSSPNNALKKYRDKLLSMQT